MSQILALRLSLRTKLLITFVLVFTGALALFAILALTNVYSAVKELAEQQERANIDFTAELAPILIYAEDLTSLIESGEEGDDLYNLVLAYLLLARGPDPSVNIHTIARSPQTGEPVYVVSTLYETDPEAAPRLRQPFENPEKYDEVFTRLNELFVINAVTDTYVDYEAVPIIDDIHVDGEGLWATAYVPMVTSQGEVVGVGWIDVRGADVADVPQRIVNASLGTAAVVFPILIVVVLLVALAIANPVRRLTRAAEICERGERFDPKSLEAVARRGDELGQLARVFSKMAVEVQAREQNLKQQVATLRIEIDRVKQEKQVKEITETDFFRDLQQRVHLLRARRSGPQASGETDDAPAR